MTLQEKITELKKISVLNNSDPSFDKNRIEWMIESAADVADYITSLERDVSKLTKKVAELEETKETISKILFKDSSHLAALLYDYVLDGTYEDEA